MNRNGRRSSVAIRSGLLEHQCYPLFLDSLKASSSSKSETRVNNRKRGHLLEYTHTHQLKDPGPSSSSHAGGAGRSWDASCACSFGSLNACERFLLWRAEQSERLPARASRREQAVSRTRLSPA